MIALIIAIIFQYQAYVNVKMASIGMLQLTNVNHVLIIVKSVSVQICVQLAKMQLIE